MDTEKLREAAASVCGQMVQDYGVRYWDGKESWGYSQRSAEEKANAYRFQGKECEAIEREIPDEADRERINEIIFKELVNGIFPETSRLYFNEVTEKLKARGCDAVVLGCTEIPLIVRPDDCPLPTLDSTRLLARAALRRALE